MLSTKSSPVLDEAKSAKSYTTVTDTSERPSLRSRDSRYSCESRSAAIKGLYPNSPLAGAGTTISPPIISRANSSGTHGGHSLRRKDRMSVSHGHSYSGSVAGTWDTNSSYATTVSGGRDERRDEGRDTRRDSRGSEGEVISVGLYTGSGHGHQGHGHPALERRGE